MYVATPPNSKSEDSYRGKDPQCVTLKVLPAMAVLASLTDLPGLRACSRKSTRDWIYSCVTSAKLLCINSAVQANGLPAQGQAFCVH